jgi:hypothetical protein
VNQYKGFVAMISEKSGTGRRGKWTLYSGKIEKEDGTEYPDWISFGFDKPDVIKGDYVKIETEADDKGYQKVVTCVKLKNPPAKATSAPKSVPTPAVGSNFDVKRQSSIHYQSSRKDAIEVLGLLIARDALPMTSAKGKAGEAARYEELMALVDKLTVRYFNDTESFRVLDSVVDEGAVEADVGQVPDQEETTNGVVDEEDDT